MRISHSTKLLMVALLMSLSSAIVSTVRAEEVIDVQDEPDHHVIFENALVRILEVDIPAGTSTLFHRHRRDNVAVVFADATTSNQRQGEPLPPPALRTAGSLLYAAAEKEAYVHRVVNSGTTAFNLLDIEFIHTPGRPEALAGRPNAAALDNERMRGYVISLSPGGSSAPMALGAAVLVALPGSTIEQTASNGKVERIDPDGPRWRWQQPGTYVLRNPSNAAAKAVYVEVK